jgi:isoquinoline 1-oxidoreductase subunit beta
MLLAAAADLWKIDRAALRAENGSVIGPGGRRLTYGQLAERAATMPVPGDPPLKDPSQWKLIGKGTKRLDSRVKVTGEATFGLDATVPGMLTAVVARPPVFGGTVKQVNADRARAVRGVKAVERVPSGVAVIATSF